MSVKKFKTFQVVVDARMRLLGSSKSHMSKVHGRAARGRLFICHVGQAHTFGTFEVKGFIEHSCFHSSTLLRVTCPPHGCLGITLPQLLQSPASFLPKPPCIVKVLHGNLIQHAVAAVRGPCDESSMNGWCSFLRMCRGSCWAWMGGSLNSYSSLIVDG